MDTAEALAAELERVQGGDAEGEAWHGPALRTMLKGMDAATATARPIPGGHNAAETLEHMAAWRDFASLKLETGERRLPPEDGWVRVDALSPAQWEAVKVRVEESLRRLAAATRAADPARLEKCRDSLKFILHHDIYHAGQVGLLHRTTAAPRVSARLYRVILPVGSVEGAARFYGALLGVAGKRVSSGRHYFDCEGTILACYDPVADGDGGAPTPIPQPVYLAVDDIEAAHRRATDAGAAFPEASPPDMGPLGRIHRRPWGEVSFYLSDPWGNPLCFVARESMFTG